jgi:hypothetical protein
MGMFDPVRVVLLDSAWIGAILKTTRKMAVELLVRSER